MSDNDYLLDRVTFAATGLHDKIVADVPQLRRGMVWCTVCGHSERVNGAAALRHGWPKHCGMTMTIDAPDEVWRAIPSSHLYEASRAGSIRRKASGKVLRPGTDTKNYMHVCLYDGRGGHKTARVHVLVAETFLGPRPDGKQVNHKDRNRSHNAATNLEYVTPSGNILHSYSGRTISGRRGEESGVAKLTEDAVASIRALLKSGARHKDIADRFGVSKTTIDRLSTNRTWQWLTP